MSAGEKVARRPVGRRPVVALALASLCAGAGGFAYWVIGGEEPEPKHCEGYLTREALSPLAGGEAVEDEPSWKSFVNESGEFESDAAEVLGEVSRCNVVLPNGDVAEFTTSTGWGGPYQPVPLSASWYSEAAPLGSGVSGWTERGRGAVLLPDACAENFPSQEPVQVTLRLRRAFLGELPAPPRGPFAEALMSYAATMAELKGCGTKEFRLSASVPQAPSPEGLPDTDHCGLPGFVATRSQDAGAPLEQTVVGSASDSWSCVVGRELGREDAQAAVAFALTTQQQVIGRYTPATDRDNRNTRAEKVICGGDEYLMIMAFGAEEGENPPRHMEQAQELAESRLKPKEELYGDFVAAARKSLGCPA
ncbi:hypothetical protein GCM10023347_03390 [Streptomyces chumphonensis]|uniref:Uncharacterized protein n=1 Tax=Streptomyces chumphonensis TaxID=1214925 RepID=A0A927F2X1_9ACTN|nr:hypothetical protein [Streptomyces chumphonensis]MBD3934223.1 hypothetical protein [Streptomyces chumphonensis]